jgi:hypothetical protein
MEKFPKNQDDQLLDYLDGKLDATQLDLLRKKLENSSDLNERLESLRVVHRTLSFGKLESPSSTFVSKVMSNLNTSPFSSGLSPKNGLLLLLGVTVAVGMLLVLLNAGIFDQFKGLVALPQTAPAQKYLQQSLPSISINGKLMIKILIGLNLMLAFLVLDKTVLRPFFQKRAGAEL